FLRSTITVCFLYTAPAHPELHTLSLHDALPIWAADPTTASAALLSICGWTGLLRLQCRVRHQLHHLGVPDEICKVRLRARNAEGDRKSTRLNSSHLGISYAVFCLKKKKKKKSTT